MKQAKRKWKVFVIALCMVFTMMPGTAFADELLDPPSVGQGVEQGLNDQQPADDELGDTDQEDGNGELVTDQDDESVPPGEEEQSGEDEDLTDETPLNDEGEQVLPENTMLLQTQFFFHATKLDLYYRENSNSGPEIAIKSVSYKNNPSGVTDLTNPYTIYIPDSDFGSQNHITFNVKNYVPNEIIDKDDVKWVLNDAGGGQETNVNVKRHSNQNKQAFHYKKAPVPPAPTTGSITISKVVQGDPMPDSDETFTFTICKDGFITTVLISSEDNYEKTISGLLPGAYTVSEVSIPTNYTLNGDNDQPVTVAAGQNSPITFTNDYHEPTIPPTTGAITITKVIQGDPMPDTDETFTFTICKEGFSTTVQISSEDNYMKKISGLMPGAYTVSEVSIPTDYTLNGGNDQPVTVTAGQNSPITFTNDYHEPTIPPTTGTITITKEIEGDPMPETGETFTFTISNDGFTTTASISSEDSYKKTIRNLPPGSYWITEVDIPDHYTIKGENSIPVSVAAGKDSPITITNVYDESTEPVVHVIKRVAEYDGSTLPTGDRFTERLTLYQLNKVVIYRISFTYNEEWYDHGVPVRLADLYNAAGIPDELTVDDLYIWDETQSKLIKANEADVNLNYIDLDETFYFFDTLEAYGTYTNTASIYASPQYKMAIEALEIELEALDSSSAVVVVEKPSDTTGGDGGGGSHTKYYVVTYNANYPSGAVTSGSVPNDSKHYSYNNAVSVKANTGDLKAENYIFKGWNTKPDGTGTMYQTGGTFKITGDTVLYAIWEPASTETVQPTPSNTVPPAEAAAALSSELDNVPKTGDSTPLLLMFMLSILSIASVTLLVRRKTLKIDTDK